MSLYFIPTDTCYWLACPISEHEDYRNIYKTKSRDLSKPLALMIEDFKWLEQNTDLNSDQISFLKNYEKPFTVLADSLPISHWINYEDEEISFENKEQYKKIAFRVANLPEQKKLLSEVGPIFLTSANYSNSPEIYSIEELKKVFEKKLKFIKILWTKDLNSNNQPSDLFEFIWEGTELKYLRKN